jgi:hypothetical protein
VRTLILIALGASLALAGCGAPEGDPGAAQDPAATAEGALSVGAGARVHGPNRCYDDSDCSLFSCDCVCKAVSDWQTTSCKDICVSLVDPCEWKETVCEKHKCVLKDVPNLCEGFEQPGCIETGCPAGQVCDITVGCFPSQCGCDPATGETWCTDDCSGGACVPDDGPCADFVQPGCVQSGCAEGFVCDTSVGCVPSVCGCDPETGAIFCTADCGGGTCVPEAGECGDIEAWSDCHAAKTEAACVAAGGSWGPQGLLGIPQCLCKTGDGGCPCTSSDDCFNLCVVPWDAEPGPGLVGHCYEYTPSFGCFNILMGDGDPVGLCID